MSRSCEEETSSEAGKCSQCAGKTASAASEVKSSPMLRAGSDEFDQAYGFELEDSPACSKAAGCVGGEKQKLAAEVAVQAALDEVRVGTRR